MNRMNEFYRGFVRTKNKACLDKFKNVPDSELRTYEEVKDLPEFAGILRPDTVLIDVDDRPQANMMLQLVHDYQLDCRVYQTRSGAHFLFKNNGEFTSCKTKCKIACGFINVDIKAGTPNAYEVLKIDGKERCTRYDIEPKEDYVNPTPKWLLPIKTNVMFKDMRAGDGRNQELFNYILTLQANGFSVDEARETIRIINRYVFQEKLDSSELETILRDEAFQKAVFFNKTKFLFDKFAVFLKSQHHIKRINGQLHLYRDGVYKAGYPEIEAAMIDHIPSLNKARRSEVLAYLEILIRQETPQAPTNLVAFKNGILDVETGELKSFSPDIVMTNIIHWNYNPAAYCKPTDMVLNNISCGDKNIRSLLEESVGYTFFRRNELGKCFFLTGSGKNGKSTFLNMIKRMLGKENRSSLDMKMLSDRFSTILIFNKLANIGDDISDEFIADSSIFKKVVTGESIGAEQKGQPKFEFEPYVKLFFSANSIPRIGKGRDSAALLRRLVIIPFNATFDKTSGNLNAYIWDDLKTAESMEYLIKLGVDGLRRILKNQAFTESDKVNTEIEEFEVTNNPIVQFFRDTEIGKLENQRTRDAYQVYTKYCYDNNIQAVSAGEFSKQAKKFYGLTIVDRRVNGEKCRLFIRSEV